MSDNMFRWEQDGDGIVTLTMDDPDHGANTMNTRFIDDFSATVDRIVAEKDSIKGVVLTSAKKSFFGGGDLKSMIKAGPEQAEELYERSMGIKGRMRALETCGVPVVAAINGAALGGGLELALACHHRVMADARGAKVGLPEVTLGLLPGGGGIVRTVRMFGLAQAVPNILMSGRSFAPDKALKAGLVDEVVEPEKLIDAAKAWLATDPEPTQPWDRKGWTLPGGTIDDPALAGVLPSFPANMRKQTKGAPAPAPRAIMAAAVEGSQVDFATAEKIEARYFVSLVTGPIAKNMIQAFFFDMQHCSSGGARPKAADGSEIPRTRFTKVGVLGAGMMGAGIAYVCAKAGIEVVLKDVEQASADKGKAYSEKLEAKALERGRTTQEKSDALLARITPTTDPQALAGCDLVIEAVFESPDLKKKVFQEIEDIVAPDALLGSNTSTLPITDLATGVKRPEDFIGLHFFSPVDKMQLVEIICGEKTTPETLAKAIDLTLQIRKIPIVVNDSRGFYTSRVIGTFVNEAIGMLDEGIEPSTIEQAGRIAGYPAAPLQLSDELNLNLMVKIRQATREAEEAAGREYVPTSSDRVVLKMVEELQRSGRAAGAGFYEYADGKRGGLWPGLREAFNTSPDNAPPLQDLIDRMIFAEVLETQKCVDEGVITDDADANIGSIIGIGFPAWTGGTRQYAKNYSEPGAKEASGYKGFVARAEELAAKYGERFAPTESLRKLAADQG
ncbi:MULTISPECIES: 3-hydroxyacyl-CoA dehydrogenase NAD-binding domain-containing protein [Dietzia]|uniref:3-hydroxyacyl-CoA dehydrogenase NAD-binding domain-containing protein n=1 Tax=Dietzia cinnamea TaxID=321318 RepID=A0A4R3ZTN9_9ACTN|nr:MULTISPECIES: 3-hydroxyacyl-CoA dehydrogenase NAD-binding domain-containing protein [Dietzia]KZO57800.1 3-hydroxyacyl-CoA dehydrogenase [Dietzia maris]MBM7230401.1 enoyl-CoA hydratase/isomerase family protein [Dietzia cinnamea]MCT1640095.1 3-hydroxyacyl-CoA dehydrogenase NAD-binding domain-containing protein [Dietzia cinnamea]MCT1864534.1 3-hydroxyacyl-CoA dehydrogenase NAD-binding domain-containing protein [Dietzia cinnamea]MCT1885497.1 3-hydroxyacyl-CoA dehydrogenase NAD-binding domain-co